MGKDILFRWEDSPALRHHCGFCDRPLSHPGARSSCFGPHSEPCHRFHQAMFMRNRGHTCEMCRGADEAHYKRHADIAERLRAIYESSGEDWPIVPSDEPERGRTRLRESDLLEEEDRSSTSGSIQPKRRDRKEQKRLNRAASRPKVLTQEDIAYIESVLHPASVSHLTEGPSNLEQIAEIEKNLRYNAQVYNTGAKRRVLRDLARLPDADVDFEGEMERILGIFRISELLKRNTKNRGLQGKHVKYFENLVAEFKEHVVDDLVLLKKDELEIRMRRAAYLRYTNRASFDIVEQRYAAKDWKTGEKLAAASADSLSSASMATIEEEEEDDVDKMGEEESVESWNEQVLTPIPQENEPDRRHLFSGHKRVGGNGDFEKVVSIRRSPTRSPYKPQGIAKKQPVQIKLVFDDEANASDSKSKPRICIRSPNRHRHKRQRPISPKGILTTRSDAELNAWHTSSEAPRAVQRQVWQTGPLIRYNHPPSTNRSPEKGSIIPVEPAESLKDELPRRKSIERPYLTDAKSQDLNHQPCARIVQVSSKALDKVAQLSATMEEGGVVEQPEPHMNVGHAAVESRKKAKKKLREADRKARRAAEAEVMDSRVPKLAEHTLVDAVSDENKTSFLRTNYSTSTGDANGDDDCRLKSLDQDTASSVEVKAASKACNDVTLTQKEHGASPQAISTQEGEFATAVSFTLVKTPAPVKVRIEPNSTMKPSSSLFSAASATTDELLEPSTPSPPVSKTGRHHDWMKHFNWLKPDGLSDPILTPTDVCAHNTTCIFETTNTLDCPYHRPHCGCNDPLYDRCLLVYAGNGAYSSGPFNRVRAEKLLCHYESKPQTKGKLMLVEEDLLEWLLTDGLDYVPSPNEGPTRNMPKRLICEISDYFLGYQKGPLMRQAELFRKLTNSNERSKHSVSRYELRQLQKGFEPASCADSICYCLDFMPDDWNEREFIECSFRDCRYKLFHRYCVRKLGTDKVSKWYCTECEVLIADAADRMLEELDYMQRGEPMPDLAAIDEALAQKVKAIGRSLGAMTKDKFGQADVLVADVD